MENNITINNEEYIFVEATNKDGASLKALYENTTIESKVDISFTRGENPYLSIISSGNDSKAIILKNINTGKVIASIVLSVYQLTLNGKVEDVLYVNGLKIAKEYQKSFSIYPRLLKFIHGIIKQKYGFYNVDKIISKNVLLYNKKDKNIPYLPISNYLCDCKTLLFKSYKKDKIGLVNGKIEGLEDFYKKVGSNFNLYPVNGIPTINDKDYYVWKKDGKIVAACAITNQEEYKSYIVRKLKGIFKILPYLPTNLFGFPRVPKQGNYVKHDNLSLLAFDESLSIKERLLFIKSASYYAKDVGTCVISMSSNDPSIEVFNKIKGVKIPSLIYSCGYSDLYFDNKPIYIDTTLI